MTRNSFSQRQKNSSHRAQAIVEFAIVLPILLMILVGILEVGRLIFMYAAVNNASREAARYASAVGLNDTKTVEKYRDCTGIKAMAKRSAFFAGSLTTTIDYDHGTSASKFDQCDGSIDTGVTVNSGTNVDRVTVTVTVHYKPMVNLIPIGERDIVSVSSRTILGILKLSAPSGGSGGSGGGGSVTDTPTATATSPTDTPVWTETPTATFPFSYTLTPSLTPTITPLPSPTPTFTPTFTPTITLTPTETFTPTATFTPTNTSTPTDVCAITAGQLDMSTTSPFITLTLTNPYVDVTVSSVYLKWNAATGAPGGKSLTWTAAILAGNTWTVNNSSGEYTSPTTVTLPGYNVTSTLTLAFNNNYKFPLSNSGTTVTVNFSTPGCASITRTK